MAPPSARTVTEIKALLDGLESESLKFNLKTVAAQKNTTVEAVRFNLAVQAILNSFLGNDWVANHIFNFAGNPKVGYTGYDSSNRYLHQLKFVRNSRLAEIFLNLQSVPGFDAVIGKLKRAKADEIESKFAEIEAAHKLSLHAVEFRFVETVDGKKTYDIKITKGDLEIPLEVKCILESTEPRVNAIKGHFKTAVEGQLPDDRPSSIFIKIPPHWFAGNDGKLVGEIERATWGFFGSGGGRVMSVNYFTPIHLFYPGAHMTRYQHVEMENKKCRHRDIASSVFADYPLKLAANGHPPGWIRLSDIARGDFPSAGSDRVAL
jgi:hypothetical protein